MNRIKAKIDKSKYGYNDFLNYRIDEYWLDEKLEELYPGSWYGGTIPTLSFGMEIEKEEKIVWERILPSENQTTNCPILMCPDDNDFSCMIIIAEIKNKRESIEWSRLGIDQTKAFEPSKIGTTVNWFDKIASLKFSKSDYLKMVEAFKSKFEIDKKEWRKKFKELNNKQK